MKLQTVLAQPKTARTWAMTEVDQTHPNIGDPDWRSKTPPGMIHGNYRLALYFDGTVRKLDKNNNPL